MTTQIYRGDDITYVIFSFFFFACSILYLAGLHMTQPFAMVLQVVYKHDF